MISYNHGKVVDYRDYMVDILKDPNHGALMRDLQLEKRKPMYFKLLQMFVGFCSGTTPAYFDF